MPTGTKTQMTTQVNDHLLTWVEGFLVDRKARGLTNNTLLYYTRKLKQFHQYAESQAATAKAGQVKLDNPACANVRKLIELSGPSLDPETVRQINASFAGDQAALRALRDVYKAHGVVYNGGLEEQIYEPESAFEKLVEHGYSALVREGSLNTLSTALSKVAALEGIQFPSMVDEQGADEVMRMAAGLTEQIGKE